MHCRAKWNIWKLYHKCCCLSRTHENELMWLFMVRNLQNRNNVSGNWKNRFQLLRHLQNYVQASQNQKLAARHKLTVTETYRNFAVRGQTQSSLRQSRHHLIDDLAVNSMAYISDGDWSCNQLCKAWHQIYRVWEF